MQTVTRRKFIQNAITYGLATSFFISHRAFAEWPAAVFNYDEREAVLTDLFGDAGIEQTSQIQIKAPEIAENGAVVPVTIQTDLTNVQSVSILVDKNPRPLAAQFIISKGNKADVGTRIKLAEQSNITAVIKADGKLYTNSKFVKVTKGGCGG